MTLDKKKKGLYSCLIKMLMTKNLMAVVLTINLAKKSVKSVAAIH